ASGATGTRTATLLLNDNAQGSPQSIPLSGIAAAVGTLNVNPSSITFSVVAVGNSTTAGFSISNPGATAVQVTGLNAAGANPSDIEITSTSCGTFPINVPASGSCFVSLKFTPAGTTRGIRSATLTAAGPQITNGPTVSLSGAVVSNTDPSLIYSTVPSPMDF